MALREVTFYTICCDKCGKSVDEGGEYAAWSDTDGAWFSVEESDWWMTDDREKVWCPDCAPVCMECGELECEEHPQ